VHLHIGILLHYTSILLISSTNTQGSFLLLRQNWIQDIFSLQLVFIKQGCLKALKKVDWDNPLSIATLTSTPKVCLQKYCA
jgi:hypothetical protein